MQRHQGRPAADWDDFAARLLANLEVVRAGTHHLLDALDEEQLIWQPSVSRWSVAQCFDHLRRFDAAYVHRIRPVVDAAPEAEADRGYRATIAGRLLLLSLAPGRRLRMPAPRYMRPPELTPGQGAAALRAFLEHQEEVSELVHRSGRRDITRVTFGWPAMGLIRLGVGDGLAIVARHELRHLEQATEVAGEAMIAAGRDPS